MKPKYTFKDWLKTHKKRYPDIWSCETAAQVNSIYIHQSKSAKSLLSLFSIYVEYNICTGALEREAVTFLTYQYLRYKVHIPYDYHGVKDSLLKLDEDDLSSWLQEYSEFRLNTIEPRFDSCWLKDKLKEKQ